MRVPSWVLIVVVSMFACSLACNATVPVRQGGPHYFRSWSGYQHPVRPQGPISYEEARSLEVYCEARYDNDGRLVLFTKYMNSKLEYSYRYEYRGRKLVRLTITKASGEVTTKVLD